ncbi:uracil phosphoribosyltransferase [Sphingomonas sp. HT-1]|uniref:uracil phosphoribosyltransferase n=1 Tax=unclassified Sphingomonas TaxID=196159 RepID=UPI0003185BE4|nr:MULTISPECIES: uracil phosphoribosyltransferase [unclassified Sphingomonas]KTF69983.1 uracil phosphoribosyltransferase [Sphingomonas sp. WG]
MIDGLTIASHPLVQHKLAVLRNRETSTARFRTELRAIAALIGYEATRHLPLAAMSIETPITAMAAPMLAGPPPVIVPILRAGLAMAEGVLDLLPEAAVAHLGLYRDPATLEAIEYYFKAPEDLADRLVLLVDPMLATGHSAIAALDRLKGVGARSLNFLCLLAAAPGVAAVRAAHPDVPIWAAGLDPALNDHGYIVPGLGDAGDRSFGTLAAG